MRPGRSQRASRRFKSANKGVTAPERAKDEDQRRCETRLPAEKLADAQERIRGLVLDRCAAACLANEAHSWA